MKNCRSPQTSLGLVYAKSLSSPLPYRHQATAPERADWLTRVPDILTHFRLRHPDRSSNVLSSQHVNVNLITSPSQAQEPLRTTSTDLAQIPSHMMRTQRRRNRDIVSLLEKNRGPQYPAIHGHSQLYVQAFDDFFSSGSLQCRVSLILTGYELHSDGPIVGRTSIIDLGLLEAVCSPQSPRFPPARLLMEPQPPPVDTYYLLRALLHKNLYSISEYHKPSNQAQVQQVPGSANRVRRPFPADQGILLSQ